MNKFTRKFKNMVVLQILQDCFRQARHQLVSNKLRSFLTLLGISIGIFCIIAVMSAVDSLEKNIIQSFEKLGNDVLYIDKFSWEEEPGSSYWKYVNRPKPSKEDFEAIKKKSKLMEAASLMIFIPGRTIKYKNNYVEGSYMAGITDDYNKVVKFDLEEGRYISFSEFQIGTNVAILGNKLAKAIFPKGDGLGKEINIYGQHYNVVGILKEEGESMINVMPYDEAIFIAWNNAKKVVNVGDDSNWGTLLSVKAKQHVDVDELKYELASIIRPVRSLKPRDEDNFSINKISILTNIVSNIFGILNLAGLFIGSFAMLVGAVGVANIMFVSVKERTPLIGIKMAIGAKRFYILLEYLIEAVILCVFGGIIGVALVWLILLFVSKALNFEIEMSVFNIVIGLFLSVLVGLISGIFPALKASRMDPVEAIRK